MFHGQLRSSKDTSPSLYSLYTIPLHLLRNTLPVGIIITLQLCRSLASYPFPPYPIYPTSISCTSSVLAFLDHFYMVRFTMYCLYHFYTPRFPFIPFQYASSPTASPPFCSPSRVSRGNDTLRTPKLVYLTSRCLMFSRLQICSLLCFRNLGGLSCSSISIAAVIRL
jgi:hypothetical protein